MDDIADDGCVGRVSEEARVSKVWQVVVGRLQLPFGAGGCCVLYIVLHVHSLQ